VEDVPLGLVTDYLHRLAAGLAAMTDGELLARYARHRDEEAFALLLRRHGPMVLGVCRRALGPTPDADDAFQATFVALARQAARVNECVAGWLYRVAVRVSRRAARRADRAQTGHEVADRKDPFAAVEWGEVRRLLDEELNRLPPRWRTPLVLCYLEGVARDEAASQLRVSLRTLHRRLDEGRARLRERLTRRGLGPAALAAAVLSADGLRSEVPPALLREAARLTAHGATIPDPIRSLIPRMPPLGGLAMKAVLLSALVIVAGLGVAVGMRQPSEAAPLPRPELPPVLVRAPAVKEKPPEDELGKKVREAQEKAVKYLKSKQQHEGAGRWSWESDELSVLQKGGTTALVTLALLECGEPAKEGAALGGLNYLRTLEPQHTYVVSLQTQAFCKANQKEDADRIKRNVKWLENAAVWNGGNLAGWSYGANPQGNRTDNSNTRYAISALYAAHKAGFKTANDKFWPAVRDYYVRTQTTAGGWTYANENPRAKGTNSMTASGLLGLVQAKDLLGKDFGPAENAVDAGFASLANEFRFQNGTSTFYNFDVVAALGRASERKDFGTRDKKIEWFRIGAEWLLAEQKTTGEWQLNAGIDVYPVIGTSFALRFLASRPD
jgi:RNA polymerase sigma factor (sigma-70 family)